MTYGTTIVYTPLIEHNDWEGETWTWWLQVNGNEAELKNLADLVEVDEDYEFDPFNVDNWVTEDEVETLVQYSHDGYFDSHNKVSGKLRVTEANRAGDLYKGGVRELFS